MAGTLQQWSVDETDPRAIHLTVWDQMSAWLENVELAFSHRVAAFARMAARQLDAGLAGLSVGVIPPALDQVSIGAIDRSRNPDIRLAIVLGMNETIFPAPPAISVLLTDADRLTLEKQGISVANTRQRLGQERFYGYVAFTRARERLVLTLSESDSDGKTLNPSPFLTQLQRLFPSLQIEKIPRSLDWAKSDATAAELTSRARCCKIGSKRQCRPKCGFVPPKKIPEIAAVLKLPPSRRRVEKPRRFLPLLPRNYTGPELRTSVSRMEQVRRLPARSNFFVHSGRACRRQRELFELDYRDQGNFQRHDVLEFFHLQLAPGK